MPDKVNTIIEELKHVGALIPESETKCSIAHADMLNGLLEAVTLTHAFMFSPSEDIKNWDIARIDGQRQLINTLSGQGYIPAKDAEIMQASLSIATEAVKRSDWVMAISSFQEYRTMIETHLPVWNEDCACVKKGDILENIAEGINVPSPIQISDTDKAAVWTNIMLKLSDGKIITPEEANDLISNWGSG